MRESTTKEEFRRHLEECMGHLKARLLELAPAGTRNAARSREPIADFCGVSVSTVTRWFNDGHMPVGEIWIKLLCFLDLSGYRVIELERMRYRNFAELVGYGLVSSEHATKLLGYKIKSQLFKMLREGTKPRQEQKMWDLWKEKKAELEQKKEEARLRSLYALDPDSVQEKTPAAIMRTEPKHVQPKTVDYVLAMVNIMEGLLKLMDEGKFDSLSSAEIQRLNVQAGNTVLRLLSHFSGLAAKLVNLSAKP